MKINFTKKQFKLLLDLIQTGSMMINGTREEDTLEEYEEIEQYIYSFVKDFNLEDKVDYDKEYNMYFPTREYEEEMEEFIARYDEDSFWQELPFKLAKRDIVKEFDGKINEENFEKVIEREFEIAAEYEDEFIENGIENLKLVK